MARKIVFFFSYKEKYEDIFYFMRVNNAKSETKNQSFGIIYLYNRKMYDAYYIIHIWDTRMILKLCLQNTQEKANFIAAKKARKILL